MTSSISVKPDELIASHGYPVNLWYFNNHLMGDIFKATILTTFVSSVVWLTLYGYQTLQTMMDSLIDSTYGSSVLDNQNISLELSDDTRHVRQEYYRISRQH